MENYSDIKKCLEELLKEVQLVSNDTSGEVNQDEQYPKNDEVAPSQNDKPNMPCEFWKGQKKRLLERLTDVEKLIQAKAKCIEDIKKRRDELLNYRPIARIRRCMPLIEFLIITLPPEETEPEDDFQDAESEEGLTNGILGLDEESKLLNLKEDIEDLQQTINTAKEELKQNGMDFQKIYEEIEQLNNRGATEIKELNTLKDECEKLVKGIKEMDIAIKYFERKQKNQ